MRVCQRIPQLLSSPCVLRKDAVFEPDTTAEGALALEIYSNTSKANDFCSNVLRAL